MSGTGVIAQGAVFDDGWCVMRWINEPKTTTLFPDLATVEKIHGHGGKTRIVYTGDAFRRGYSDCMQDRSENAPFGSVGGIDRAANPVAPEYVTPDEHEEYLTGYKLAALVEGR